MLYHGYFLLSFRLFETHGLLVFSTALKKHKAGLSIIAMLNTKCQAHRFMLWNMHTLSKLPWVRPWSVTFTLSHFTNKCKQWIKPPDILQQRYIISRQHTFSIIFQTCIYLFFTVPITFILLVFLHIFLPFPLFCFGVIIEKAVSPKSPVCNPHSIKTLIGVQIQYSLITLSCFLFLSEW